MKIRCAKCFKSVGVTSRFRIFEYLKKEKGEVTVSELVNLVMLSQPTVTFHVNKLAQVGLVSKRKEGREVYCRVAQLCVHDCPLLN